MERFLFREPWQSHILKVIFEVADRPVKARIDGKLVDITFYQHMVEMMFAYARRGKVREAMEIAAFLKFLPNPEFGKVKHFDWNEEQEKLYQRLDDYKYEVGEEEIEISNNRGETQ
jgi:hypothetical protein